MASAKSDPVAAYSYAIPTQDDNAAITAADTGDLILQGSDSLASYSFNGWISGFHTLNPYQSDEDLATDDHTGVNHVLVLDLEAAMNQANFADIQLSN